MECPSATGVALPAVFEPGAYRAANDDLASFGDAELDRHYRTYGEAEGRRANALASREAFAALVPGDADSLEIGPYYSPLLHGPQTKYFDVLSRDAMLVRAQTQGFDASNAPEIDYVSATGDLTIVDARFDNAFSSHAIEHQPDLIAHLQSVQHLLRPGGRYFLIVPDKRFCYDHFSPESSLADIVAASYEKRTVHSLRNVLGQAIMSTHNDSARHWNGDHGTFGEQIDVRVSSGLTWYEEARGTYLDVHAWYFTPESARLNFRALRDARYVDFELERLYPTRRNTFEFWMVLRKPATGERP